MIYQPGDTILNTYRIEERIGEGSFGEVYRVTHLGLKVERAIKILKRDAPGLGSAQYADFQQRFQLEAQLGARLNSPTPHPNLLQVHHFHQGDDLLFLEMEYAPGGSLAERIAHARKTKQPIPIDEAIQIGIDIASGLAVLHEQDIVHRDVKPSNILFDDRGRAKVADLGLAQIPGGASMRSQLSKPEPHPGTPAYMSIEQKNSRDYLTSASDVYTLGAVLFEMLTGRIYSGQRADTRARSLRPDTPKWLDDLIARMLSENPQARPWDGAEVVELLRQGDGDKKKCLGKFPRWVCWGMFLMIGLGVLFGAYQLIDQADQEVILPTPTATSTATIEITDTPTPTLTTTPSPTLTKTIAPTRTSTITVQPTYTPSLTPIPVAVVMSNKVYVRYGPSTSYGTIEIYSQNDEFDVLGRNIEANWILLALPIDQQGWVALNDVKLSIDVLSLPLVEVPATPLPLLFTLSVTNHINVYETKATKLAVFIDGIEKMLIPYGETRSFQITEGFHRFGIVAGIGNLQGDDVLGYNNWSEIVNGDLNWDFTSFKHP